VKTSLIFSCLFLIGRFAVPVHSQKILLLPVAIDGKMGYIDTTGKIMIQPQYELAHFFHNDGTAWVKKDDLYYLINTTGMLINAAGFEKTGYPYMWKGRTTCIAQKNGKYGLVDSVANEVVPFVFDRIYSFKSGIAEAEKGGKKGFTDTEGNFTSLSKYSWIENLGGGYLRVRGKDESPWIYNTLSKRVELGPFFLIDPLRFGKFIVTNESRDHLIITPKGETLLGPMDYYISPAVYIDSIYVIRELGKKEEQSGIINLDGKVLLKPTKEFSDISFFRKIKGQLVAEFMQRKSTDEKKLWGIINVRGEILLKPVFDDVSIWNENVIQIKEAGKSGLIDWNGKVIVPAIYDDISFVDGEVISIKLGKDYDEMEGYMNYKTGRIIWTPTYRRRTK
jgi:hypothetical protein